MKKNLYSYIKGKTKYNILLSAEGGTGKTYQMVYSFKKILADDIDIPIYVDVKELDYNNQHPIFKYIADKFMGKIAENENFDVIIPKKLGFDKSGEIKYIFFIDGLNETTIKKNILSDINKLKGFPSCSMVVSSRVDEDGYVFEDFEKIKLKKISQTKVTDYIKEAYEIEEKSIRQIDADLLEILEYPLFLKVFCKAYDRKNVINFLDRSIKIRKTDILSAYTDKILQDIRHRAVTDENELIEFVLKFFIPRLAYLLVKNGKFTINHQSVLSLLNEAAPENLSVEYFNSLLNGKDNRKFISIYKENLYNIMEYCLNSALIKYSEHIDSYGFLHHIWRDYFCAKHIENCIINEKRISSRPFVCNKDVITLLANILINENQFVSDKGELTVNSIEFENLFLKRNSLLEFEDSLQDILSNYCFIVYNLLEDIPNGSAIKTKFCDNIIETNSRVYKLLEKKLQFKQIEISSNLLELIRLHSEMLRRLRRYKEAIEVSTFLKEYAIGNRYYCFDPQNNIAKCHLYEGFYMAKEERTYSLSIQEKYDLAVSELKKLSDEGYALSRNLLALLMAYPDCISGEYIDVVFKNINIEQRRLNAFCINWGTLCEEYKNANQDNFFYYPMIQCISYILRKDISCISPLQDIQSCVFEDYLRQNRLSFGIYSSKFDSSSFALAKKMLDVLGKRKENALIYSLRVKLMLLQGEFDEGKINPLVERSKNQPFAIFVSSLFNGIDIKSLERLKELIIRRAKERAPDSFDPMYIQEDLNAIWKVFINKGYRYSEEFRSAVYDLLKTNIKGETYYEH